MIGQVQIFPPRFKYFHRGLNISTPGGFCFIRPLATCNWYCVHNDVGYLVYMMHIIGMLNTLNLNLDLKMLLRTITVSCRCYTHIFLFWHHDNANQTLYSYLFWHYLLLFVLYLVIWSFNFQVACELQSCRVTSMYATPILVVYNYPIDSFDRWGFLPWVGVGKVSLNNGWWWMRLNNRSRWIKLIDTKWLMIQNEAKLTDNAWCRYMPGNNKHGFCYMCNDRPFYMIVVVGYSDAGWQDCSCGPQWRMPLSR